MLTSNENILNSKSRLLRLSTEDKVLGTQGRFTIDFISQGGLMDNVKGYMVHSMQCPNVFDNIPEYANTLQLIKTTGAVVFDVVLTNSFYYIDDLIIELQNKINAAITTDSVAIIKVGNAPNEKLQFTFTGDEYTLNFLNSTIGSRLGLTADLVCPATVSTTLNSIPNLIGETEVYAHSRVLCPNNLIEGGGSFSVIDKLNLNAPFGSMCYSDFDNDKTHFKKYFPFESTKTLRTIKITLRNRTGSVLTLPDNFNFSMMLMIYYK